MAKLPEQILFDRTNDLRKELEGKIEKKIDSHVFYWVMGILISIVIFTFSTAFFLIFKSNDNHTQLKEEIIRLESQLENKKVISPQG